MIELSLALGKTLEEIRQMPKSDFDLYFDFYQEQPFGLWRQDYNSAVVARSMTGETMSNLMPFWQGEEVQIEAETQTEETLSFFKDAIVI